MTLSNWWTKRIRVNKPIDWANTWSLEEQARGISFEMDDQKNLKALPVVIVDTTRPNIVPAAATASPAYWYQQTTINTPGMLTVHTPPIGMDSYLDSIILSVADATRAAAGLQTIWVYNMPEDEIFFRYTFYQAATAGYVAPFVFHFPYPDHINGGVKLQIGTALTGGNIYVQMWGHDA